MSADPVADLIQQVLEGHTMTSLGYCIECDWRPLIATEKDADANFREHVALAVSRALGIEQVGEVRDLEWAIVKQMATRLHRLPIFMVRGLDARALPEED